MRKKPVPPTLCLMLTIPVLWLAVIAASVYENGINVFELVSRLTSAVNHPFAVRWTAYTPRFLLAFLLLYGGGVLLYYSGRENRRPGQEYGSAQWGSPWQLNKKYADKDFTNNTLLTRHVAKGPLPVPVRLMMDEFCNVALPSDFVKIQSTMRSRNIMSTIVLQNISGLKALFKDDWEGLLGNADTLLYLGGNEQSTHKYISEMLGKETLDVRHTSTTKGRNGSTSVSRQQLARDLMTPDEVRAMDNRCALLFIRGERPVMDEKYDILRHPNLSRTEDGGAAPYVHKLADYTCADMSAAFVSLEELILLEGFTEWNDLWCGA